MSSGIIKIACIAVNNHVWRRAVWQLHIWDFRLLIYLRMIICSRSTIDSTGYSRHRYSIQIPKNIQLDNIEIHSNRVVRLVFAKPNLPAFWLSLVFLLLSPLHIVLPLISSLKLFMAAVVRWFVCGWLSITVRLYADRDLTDANAFRIIISKKNIIKMYSNPFHSIKADRLVFAKTHLPALSKLLLVFILLLSM